MLMRKVLAESLTIEVLPLLLLTILILYNLKIDRRVKALLQDILESKPAIQKTIELLALKSNFYSFK